jgi:hypothetical protein
MVIVEQLVEWRLAGETKVPGENLHQCHFVHHKSHKTWPRSPQWERWEVASRIMHVYFVHSKTVSSRCFANSSPEVTFRIALVAAFHYFAIFMLNLNNERKGTDEWKIVFERDTSDFGDVLTWIYDE